MRKPFQRKESWKTVRGRAGAAVRWHNDRARRAKLAAIKPLQHPGKIVRRIVVIDREIAAREAIIFDSDSTRDARRKLRAVLCAFAPLREEARV
jgi:hypothetical protein